MAASISQLKEDYLRRARNACAVTDYQAQHDWLWAIYQTYIDGGDAEVTSTSYKGQSSQVQYRTATPEDHRLALGAAIDEIDALIAGETAAQFSRPFAIRFSEGPSTTL